MPQSQVKLNVRKAGENVGIIDVEGELTVFAEDVLMEAYNQASVGGTHVIILNFRGVDYITSGGIGLLVTLLVRANCEKRRLLTYGLSEHYKGILQTTRLDEAIGIYNTEEEAIQEANAGKAVPSAKGQLPDIPGKPIKKLNKTEQAPQSQERGDEKQTKQPREAAWAPLVKQLKVRSNVPIGAVSINVEGHQVMGPLQGFGKMWQKTYKVRLEGATVTPSEVIRTWKENYQEFWPERDKFYTPVSGISPGEVALINSTAPGGIQLSTGVMVLYADDESFSLMTPQGHPFSGWITFSAFKEDDVTTIAQAQILMRAGDPLYEIGLRMGGHKMEDRLWQHTLRSLATHFGVDEPVETNVVCLDPKLQWRKCHNIWYNAGIRSALYMMAAFLRSRPKRASWW